MYRVISLVLLLAILPTSARSGDAAEEQANPVLKYSGIVQVTWLGGSSLCKRAAGVDMSICAKWFDDPDLPKPKDYWSAAKSAVARESEAWNLLRDLRATYESCVQQARFPGAIAVISYRRQLAECEEKIHRSVSLLKIETE